MSAYIIGIAGGSGSGKSTFASNVHVRFPQAVTILNSDNYYFPHGNISMDEREKFNYDEPSAIDFELLTCHVKQLKAGKAISKPVYDFKCHDRSSVVEKVNSTPIIIVDGILIFNHQELMELFDLKVYVETDADERVLRRLRRDIVDRGRSMDSVINQYINTVKPMHNMYVEPTKNFADIIVNGGQNISALDVVCAKIRTLLYE